MGERGKDAERHGPAATEAERLWRALAEAVDAIVFVTEPGGRMIWANGQLERRTGFRVEDFWFDNHENPFLHPEDAQRVGEAVAAFLASDAEHLASIDNRFFDRWGTVHHFRSSVSKVTWQGAPALLFVVGAIPAPPAEPANEARYRQIVESASDGIVEMYGDGRVAFSNRRFQELVGYDAVELGRRGFLGCVSPRQRAGVASSLAAAGTDGTAAALECELVCADGSARYASVGLARLADDGLLLALVRDVTESRRIEAGLRESEKLESLGVLAAGVAHDFNNVVTAILASADYATKLVDPGTKLAAAVREIQSNAHRAADVTSALLHYLGKTSRRRDEIDLRVVVRDAIPLLRGVVAKDVALEVSEGDAAAVVLGDGSQLARVVVNLVMNAAEASGGRGAVRISVRVHEPAPSSSGRWIPGPPPSGSVASLVVEDKGPGIDRGRMDRIFDPFFTTKDAGRGLGLSAVLGIVRSHGGAVRVVSEPGVRTVFEVVLPLATASEPAPPPLPTRSSLPPAGESAGVVLFVDDERSLRTLGQWILEEAGWEVVTAENAPSALAAFDASPDRFTAAVIDYGLPGMRGDELLARLRAKRPDLPAIVTSGYIAREVPRDLPHVFLAKPYGGEELQDAVRDLVRDAAEATAAARGGGYGGEGSRE